MELSAQLSPMLSSALDSSSQAQLPACQLLSFCSAFFAIWQILVFL